MERDEHTWEGPTVTAAFRMTDAPGYISHIEITRDGDKVILQVIKRNGYVACEAAVGAKRFFRCMDKLEDF